jgi:hypothetical protein
LGAIPFILAAAGLSVTAWRAGAGSAASPPKEFSIWPPIASGRRAPTPYGKIAPPADIALTPADGGAGELHLVVAASSRVAAESGAVTLEVPEIAGEPARTQVLWAGTPGTPIDETLEYSVGMLPTGRYRFNTILEFMPKDGGAEQIAVSDSLYLEVTPTEVLASNVSFEHIARMELRRELERRVMAMTTPGIGVAGVATESDHGNRLEGNDADDMDRAIARLKASDPDVARRVRELNERVVAPETVPDEGKKSQMPAGVPSDAEIRRDLIRDGSVGASDGYFQ